MIIYKGWRLSMKPFCEKSVYTTDLYITGLRSLVEKSVPILLNKMAGNWFSWERPLTENVRL